jgi:ABC-type tungstate transport system substrate-binding protein
MRRHLTLLVLSWLAISSVAYALPQQPIQMLWYVAYALGAASGFLVGYYYFRFISRISPREPLKMFAFLFASFFIVLGAALLLIPFYAAQNYSCFLACPQEPTAVVNLSSSVAAVAAPIAFTAGFAIFYLAYRLAKRADVIVH